MKNLDMLAKALVPVALVWSVGAAAVPITSSGIWTAAVPSASGINTNQISWGSPATSAGQSSYIFNGVNPGDAPLDGMLFEIGSFTHNNFPIFAPLLTGADLRITLNFTDAGVSQSFDYEFEHTETPNNANPCAEGGVSPCPDLVSIPDASSTETILLGTDFYRLNIVGFSQDGGSTVTGSFLTLENAPNTAALFAQLELVPTEIPEPPTLALISVVLLGIGAYKLRARAG